MVNAKFFNYQKGRGGESLAQKFLEDKEFILIEKNYQDKIGEIDLIMADNDTLVFVEVKMKTDDKFGLPEEMISKGKIYQIKRVAQSFLKMRPNIGRIYTKYRIDAVCILSGDIKHYSNIG